MAPQTSRLRLRQRLRHLRAMLEPPPESFDALVAEGIVVVGPHSYGEPDVAVWRSVDGDLAGDPVIIGDYCSIANGVVLLTGGNHRTDWVSTFPFRIRNDLPGKGRDGQIYSNGELRIGNDVWIGRGALITSGVNVGHGAVIAAHAVVARDVPPYTVVAGNPARVVRERFTAEQTEALLEIAWWEWPDDVVGEHVDLLLSPDIDAFIAAARRTGAQLAQANARS